MRFIIPAAIFIAAGVFFAAVPLVPSVTVRDARSGRLAASLPFKKGGIVGLAYIHSANKGAVLDEFRVADDGALVLFRSVFQSFGAGMSDGLEAGLSMRLTKDGVELTGLNRKIGTLRMAVGTIANHRLRVAGQEITLAQRVGAGSFVRIAYERIAFIQAIQERIGNGREQSF